MSIPPPPPPPPPALPQPEPLNGSSEGTVRSALLADIQRGIQLKKVTQVNDCSAPVLHKTNRSNSEDNGNGGTTRGSAGSAPLTQGPTLSGLFAGGFPVLRPVGQQNRGSLIRPVTRSGSTASLKQPQWNLPSQEQSFTGSTPDLSPSRKPLTRTTSLSKTRPVSSYTAPSSPSQITPPSYKSLFSPPPLPSLHPERPSNRPPPVPTSPPPPPPPQTTKPTWLPVQSHSIPMPTTPPPPHPSIPDRSSTQPSETKYSNFRSSLPPPPPPHTNSVPCSFSSPLSPPPPPPPPKVLTMPAYKPTVSAPGHPHPCRRPPPIPRSAGAPRLAPPPAPPSRFSTTELSSRIPPPPPPPPLPQAPPSSVRNGHLYSLDDFESKFQFHPVEDFPPPEAFRHFPRVYPSKENRVCLQPPGIRTYLR